MTHYNKPKWLKSSRIQTHTRSHGQCVAFMGWLLVGGNILMQFLLVCGLVSMMGGCRRPDDTTDISHQKYDAATLVKRASAFRNEGRTNQANACLVMAAKQHNVEAVDLLKRYAHGGDDHALACLCDYYESVAKDRQWLDCIYNYAMKDHEYLLPSGILHIFGCDDCTNDEQALMVEHGVECLKRVGGVRGPMTYLLLSDLAESGVIPKPDDAEYELWQQKARSATYRDIQLLVRALEKPNLPKIKPFYEKWKAKASTMEAEGTH